MNNDSSNHSIDALAAASNWRDSFIDISEETNFRASQLLRTLHSPAANPDKLSERCSLLRASLVHFTSLIDKYNETL